MAYDTELVHVAVTYSAQSSSDWAPEIAMTTFWLRHHHFEGDTFSWTTDLDALPGQLKGKFDDHWGDLGPWCSNKGAITQIKCTHIDAAGHAVRVAFEDIVDFSLLGSGGTTMMPPEVALVVSQFGYTSGGFTTHKGRKRGRFYLPYLPASLLANDGKVSATNLSTLADAWQGFINDVQGMHVAGGGEINPDYWDWVVTSRIDASWENVEFIAVDNHFDVQRRRQHQSPATREERVISHS